jgi:hypothetical protein
LEKTVAAGQPTDYFARLGEGDYLSPGTFTITGVGGADIGSLTAMITIPPFPSWTNQASSGMVDRTKGLTFTWSGGSSPYITLFGGSATDSSATNGAVFACLAKGDAGSFTVPPNVLLAMPVGPNGLLTFEPNANPTTFAASGLALGYVTSNADTSILATFR